MNESAEWPQRPSVWPDVLTDCEVALYMRFDLADHSPESAKLALRHLRRARGFPRAVRVTRKLMLTPRPQVDAWLAAQSHRISNLNVPAGSVDGQALTTSCVSDVSLC